MRKKIKIALIIITAAIIVFYMIFAYFKGINANAYNVQTGNFAQSFKEEGKVINDVEMPVCNIVSGKINKINVQNGQAIKKGDSLIKLDTTQIDYQIEQLKGQLLSTEGQRQQNYRKPYNSQLEQQKLQIDKVQKQLDTARKDLEKMKILYEAGAISKKEYEDSQNSVTDLENALSQQKAALNLITEETNPLNGTESYYEGLKKSIDVQISQLEYQKSQCDIKSPIEGVVKDLDIKEGMVINSGTQILNIFTPNNYKVEVNILTKDAPNIKTDMKVNLIQETKTKDMVYKGRVEKISAVAEEKISPLGLKEQRVKITVLPQEIEKMNIKPGYALDVEFITYINESAIFIPKTAIFTYKSGEAVWMVNSGKAQIQPVEKGVENERFVVITSGLKQGDIILLNPDETGLKEGKRINPVF